MQVRVWCKRITQVWLRECPDDIGVNTRKKEMSSPFFQTYVSCFSLFCYVKWQHVYFIAWLLTLFKMMVNVWNENWVTIFLKPRESIFAEFKLLVWLESCLFYRYYMHVFRILQTHIQRKYRTPYMSNNTGWGNIYMLFYFQ